MRLTTRRIELHFGPPFATPFAWASLDHGATTMAPTSHHKDSPPTGTPTKGPQDHGHEALHVQWFETNHASLSHSTRAMRLKLAAAARPSSAIGYQIDITHFTYDKLSRLTSTSLERAIIQHAYATGCNAAN